MSAQKKIVGAIGGLTAIAATVALTAGTFSYFSEAKTIDGAGGTVSMGTLHLTAGTTAGTQAFSINNAKPGDTVLSANLGFTNTGTIDGVLNLEIKPNGGNSQALNDAIIIDLDGFGAYNESAPFNNPTPLTTLAAAGEFNASPMFGAKNGQPGRHKSMPIKVTIDPQAGNDIQGLSGGFTVVATLVQAGSPNGPVQDNF
jgi:hypothetical protein